MKKKIIIFLVVVLVVAIANVIVFQFLGNDNEETVEYHGGYNVSESDDVSPTSNDYSYLIRRK